MTAAQLTKARRHAPANVEFVEGLIEAPPVFSESVDVVIANGAINLAPDKQAVFDAAAWALRPGGRLAFAVVVVRAAAARAHAAQRRAVGGVHRRRDPARPLPRGGRGRRAARPDRAHQRRVSLRLGRARRRPRERYGVTSVSVLAVKPYEAKFLYVQE